MFRRLFGAARPKKEEPPAPTPPAGDSKKGKAGGGKAGGGPNGTSKSKPPRSAGAQRRPTVPTANRASKSAPSSSNQPEEVRRLKGVIEGEILDRSPGIVWADVAGLEDAKRSLKEMVILPTQRADLFQGLRAPPRGLLLFGPPGTGKTMLAKAVATEAKATFFCVSASSLTSKWVGEGEKMVRALFAAAADRAPAVIFLDEIDSVLSARSSQEHEASRRLKTEFLLQMDGVGTGAEQVVVLAATNRPEDLDEALLRRLPKRIYVPLPDADTRRALLRNLLKGAQFQLPEADIENLARLTDGFSCSDMTQLCKEAALQPLREMGPESLEKVPATKVRGLHLGDFELAMRSVRPSVPKASLERYAKWDRKFGMQAAGGGVGGGRGCLGC